jgi:hypothetical protein
VLLQEVLLAGWQAGALAGSYVRHLVAILQKALDMKPRAALLILCTVAAAVFAAELIRGDPAGTAVRIAVFAALGSVIGGALVMARRERRRKG